MEEAEGLPTDALNTKERDPESPNGIPYCYDLDVNGLRVLKKPRLLDCRILQLAERVGALQLPDGPIVLPLVALIELLHPSGAPALSMPCFAIRPARLRAV